MSLNCSSWVLLLLHSITLTVHRVTHAHTLTKPSFVETIPLDVAFTRTFTVQLLKYQSFLNIGTEGDYVRRLKVSI